MPKLILDVMGGDLGPSATLEGGVEALDALNEQDELVLVGDEQVIRPLLQKTKRLERLAEALSSGKTRRGTRVHLLHAAQTIDMEDSIRAIRSKPDATINVGLQLAGRDYAAGKPSAFISAGHSGAVMASALLKMGRLRGAERPAIAVKLPTLSQDGCVVLDVGANVDCKPEHLRDFALMGALFAHVEKTRPGLPKVALLSNGEERSKGNELTRASLALIENLEVLKPGPQAIGEFVGYAEGKEIFKGLVDVVVTDGFVGNILLKTAEGLGSAVMRMVKEDARKSLLAPLGFLLAGSVFMGLKKKLDYAEYGAAPLLGVAGYAFICHGRSNPRAIKNALLRAREAVLDGYVQRLEVALQTSANPSTPDKVPTP